VLRFKQSGRFRGNSSTPQLPVTCRQSSYPLSNSLFSPTVRGRCYCFSGANPRGIKTLSEAKTDILSGLTVALALVPEAIAFALVAHVHPLVGLYAAFMVSLTISLFGGRPGMISGAITRPIPAPKFAGLDKIAPWNPPICWPRRRCTGARQNMTGMLTTE